MKRFATAAEAARRMGVATSTVTRWIEQGKLPVHHRTLGGHYRILITDVERLVGERR